MRTFITFIAVCLVLIGMGAVTQALNDSSTKGTLLSLLTLGAGFFILERQGKNNKTV